MEMITENLPVEESCLERAVKDEPGKQVMTLLFNHRIVIPQAVKAIKALRDIK